MFLVFFFSSRRRHTRLQGDWSSDVCSSDLEGCDMTLVLDSGALIALERNDRPTWRRLRQCLASGGIPVTHGGRSEERRVGKECRARGGAGEWRKKESGGERGGVGTEREREG